MTVLVRCDREDCRQPATSSLICGSCGRVFARCYRHGGDKLARKWHQLHQVAAHQALATAVGGSDEPSAGGGGPTAGK